MEQTLLLPSSVTNLGRGIASWEVSTARRLESEHYSQGVRSKAIYPPQTPEPLQSTGESLRPHGLRMMSESENEAEMDQPHHLMRKSLQTFVVCHAIFDTRGLMANECQEIFANSTLLYDRNSSLHFC